MNCPYFKQAYDVAVCTALSSSSLPGFDQIGHRCFKEGFITCSIFRGCVSEMLDQSDKLDLCYVRSVDAIGSLSVGSPYRRVQIKHTRGHARSAAAEEIDSTLQKCWNSTLCSVI